jgi:hypothetical protein
MTTGMYNWGKHIEVLMIVKCQVECQLSTTAFCFREGFSKEHLLISTTSNNMKAAEIFLLNISQRRPGISCPYLALIKTRTRSVSQAMPASMPKPKRTNIHRIYRSEDILMQFLSMLQASVCWVFAGYGT